MLVKIWKFLGLNFVFKNGKAKKKKLSENENSKFYISKRYKVC